MTDSSSSFGRQNLHRYDHGSRRSDGLHPVSNSNLKFENVQGKAQSTGVAVIADNQGKISLSGTRVQLKEIEGMSRNRIFWGIYFNCLAPGHMKSLCTDKV
jgi:hypothetical protein